eukprot:5546743-Amphidinium_carterae.1
MLLHVLVKAFARAAAFVNQPVGFSTNPSPCQSDDVIPHEHMGPSVYMTLGSCLSSSIRSSCHDSALLGCSCKKYLPDPIWFQYI